MEFPLMVFMYVQGLVAERRSRIKNEDGLSVAETVIITAIFAAGAIAISIYLIGKFTNKAHSIKTG
jgi:hypothetical protein